MAEAGGGRSRSGPARPPAWGRGLGDRKGPPRAWEEPRDEEAPERGGEPTCGAESRAEGAAGSGEARKSLRDGAQTRVPGPASLRRAPGPKCPALPRRPNRARVSAALPAPQQQASAGRRAGSQRRPRRGPGQGQGRQQVQRGTSPRPVTGSARECGRSGRGGSPSSAAEAPCFQGDARYVHDVRLHGNEGVKKKRMTGKLQWASGV